MNILQIHNFYKNRGGEHFVLESEKKLLEENGHKVIQINADNNNLKIYIKKRHSFYSKIINTINNYKIDIAHIHNVHHIIGPKIYKILSNKNIPIVQTLHNFRFLCINGLFYDNKNNICELCKDGNLINSVVKKCYHNSYLLSFLMANRVRKTKKYVKKYVSRFIALNSFAKNKMVEGGFDKNKISIKPNFLRNNKIKKYSDKNYALYIGRLSREKGIGYLLKAFEDLDFELKIAGSGPFKNIVKKYSDKHDNIDYLGYVSGKQKIEYLSNCSFIIVPSTWYEMFPISILEAYKYIKPVIATDLGGIPEIVKDGISGFLFEKDNIESLKNSINKIIKGKKYIKMGKNARKIFEKKYTAEENYRLLMDIYQKAIKNAKQRFYQ